MGGVVKKGVVDKKKKRGGGVGVNDTEPVGEVAGGPAGVKMNSEHSTLSWQKLR